MPRGPSAPVSSQQAILHAHLLDTELDRPKRIDQYIDYFGDGRRAPGQTEERKSEVNDSSVSSAVIF